MSSFKVGTVSETYLNALIETSYETEQKYKKLSSRRADRKRTLNVTTVAKRERKYDG